MSSFKLQAKRKRKADKRKKKKAALKAGKLQEDRTIAKSRGIGFYKINKHIARIMYQHQQKERMSHADKTVKIEEGVDTTDNVVVEEE